MLFADEEIEEEWEDLRTFLQHADKARLSEAIENIKLRQKQEMLFSLIYDIREEYEALEFWSGFVEMDKKSRNEIMRMKHIIQNLPAIQMYDRPNLDERQESWRNTSS